MNINPTRIKSNSFISIAIVLASILLMGCSAKVLDYRNAEIANGMVYERGANKPFSGKLTNLKYLKLPDIAAISELSLQAKRPLGMQIINVLCDVHVKNGYLNGNAVCKLAQSQILVAELSYENGAIDGAVKFYDLSKENRIVGTVDANNGLLDGEEKIVNPANGKLVLRIKWKDGKKNGVEEQFDITTGELILHQEWKDDLLHGKIKQYSPEGKLIYQNSPVNNLKDGTEEEYDSKTGKVIGHGEWTMGKRNGTFQRWDASGNLINDQRYENDVLVEDRLKSSAPSTTRMLTDAIEGNASCIDSWTNAYHKEQGEDAMITTAQLDEWTQWCAQGKHP